MPRDPEATMDETGEGRIITTVHLSNARVALDLAMEAMEDYEVMFVPERADAVREHARQVREHLAALADEIMEPFGIANVLQMIEEVVAHGETADRREILCASVDAREDAMEDEREPTDDELYNRPGMEGGIGYSLAGDTRDEHDPTL